MHTIHLHSLQFSHLAILAYSEHQGNSFSATLCFLVTYIHDDDIVKEMDLCHMTDTQNTQYYLHR